MYLSKPPKVIFYGVVLFVIIGLISLQGCAKKEEKSEIKTSVIKAYTSIFALEQFIKSLLPDAFVETILPSGVDPHHYEPSLKDVRKLYSADVILYIGDTDVDRWIDNLRKELSSKGVRLIRLKDIIPMKNYSGSRELDPHIWLDPHLGLEIADRVKNELIKLFSDRKSLIEKNFLSYEQRLRELDRTYRETLSGCLLRDVITTHEFLNYPADRYGFISHFIVHEPEDEPSPKRIKHLKEIIKKNSIEYIVTEQEGDRIARTLSQETGTKILYFNTYHGKTERDYISVMQDNLKILSKALKCKKDDR
ncbi:zinc ABC transporter substrate-binding protein [Thermodesulfovibrio sp.]|uniref:metal ABC transporter substrate-binding protein n=1 Tax=Thermodesulfovibrio sp. TaxID=2067987 RepID=UPI0030B2299B